MRFYLESAYLKDDTRLRYRRNEYIVSISRDDKIVCWALLMEYRQPYGRWKRVINIYTRSSERGKGLGTIIVNLCIDLASPSKLYCMGSPSFFQKFGIKHIG